MQIHRDGAPSERRRLDDYPARLRPPHVLLDGRLRPDVDPVLPRFAADLEWLRSQGVAVERFNLAQQPGAFAAHPEVRPHSPGAWAACR